MSGSPKENLQTHGEEEVGDERELYLRDGRKLIVGEHGGDQLVEIRSQSGMVELRIRLTEEGPVLLVESARLSLKATEAVEIESRRVELKGTEQLVLTGGHVEMTGEQDVDVTAKGTTTIIGSIIHLNPDK